MTYRYHPELQELVDDPAGFPPAEKFVGTLEEMRAFADPLYAEMRDLPLAEGVVARDVEIETADGYPMRARWYRKEGSDARSAVMYVHGGGMILMGIDEMDADISRYVALSGVPFLSIGYRLAPEHPRPQAEDALDGYLWLIGHADELGIDAHRVAIMGDSGGAGIAAGAAILARDRGVPLAKQILIYPMLDDRETASSRDNHAPVWNTRTNRFAWKYYLRDLDGVTPPSYAAPARETNYAGLPPAYTYVGTEEPFYCETLEYVANLKRAGVEASVDVHPHWFHAYDMLFPFAKKSREAVRRFEEHYLHAAEHYFAPQEKRLFSQQPKAEPVKRMPDDGNRWPSAGEPSTASGATAPWRVWRVAEHPEMAEEAATWFSAKWGIPEEAYRESMQESAHADGAVVNHPVMAWYH